MHLAVVLASVPETWAHAPDPTRHRIREFLRTADVIAAESPASGITQSWHLTLRDGTRRYDASFQSVDHRKTVARLVRSRALNFVDSYRYNMAAFQVAEIVGVLASATIVGWVTVEREWNGQGAINWWIDDVMFDEATRLEERQRPDGVSAWRAQLGCMAVLGWCAIPIAIRPTCCTLATGRSS